MWLELEEGRRSPARIKGHVKSIRPRDCRNADSDTTGMKNTEGSFKDDYTIQSVL